jgi:hypothetical protein
MTSDTAESGRAECVACKPAKLITMPFSDTEYISVVIIGGGQAGLSASYCLRKRGVDDHVIFEKNRIAHAWRAERWDSFCLVTPNHQCRLPGHPYQGDDPEGFMPRDEVADYIERFAKKFRPPVLEGVTVTSITKRDGYFHLTTNQGSWYCDDVTPPALQSSPRLRQAGRSDPMALSGASRRKQIPWRQPKP